MITEDNIKYLEIYNRHFKMSYDYAIANSIDEGRIREDIIHYELEIIRATAKLHGYKTALREIIKQNSLIKD